jgi:hypothetical protein
LIVPWFAVLYVSDSVRRRVGAACVGGKGQKRLITVLQRLYEFVSVDIVVRSQTFVCALKQ